MIPQICPSAYTFPFVQRGEKGFHPPQMCSSAVLQDPNCMSLDADDVSICWMLIGWQVGWKREGSNSRVHQEQEIKTSKIKKMHNEKHREWLQWTCFIAFTTLFHFTSFYVVTLLFSVAGWWKNNNMSDPQTSCTTYLYTASIWQQSSLQADGQSLNQSRQQMLPLLDYKSHLGLRCRRGVFTQLMYQIKIMKCK